MFKHHNGDVTKPISDIFQTFFFEKMIYFHKTNLQKNHTYIIHTINKKAENKDNKKARNIKRRKRKKWG